MLLELRVANFRSIAEEQAFSMVAHSDKKHPTHVMAAGKHKVVRSALIYGANGAGKSNLLRALALLRYLVVRSASFQPSDALPAEPHLLDDSLSSKPTELEVHFIQSGTRYQYGVLFDSERVHKEWLYAYPEGRAQRWFTRDGDEYKFGPSLEGEKQSIKRQTRPNALYLSTAANLNNEQLTGVFMWFMATLRAYHIGYRTAAGAGAVPFDQVTSRFSEANPRAREEIARLLRRADTGISDFAPALKKWREDELPSDLPESMRKAILSQDQQEVRTRHRTRQGREVWFDLDVHESEGTRKVYTLLGPWMESLANGYVLVMDDDQFDVHPSLAAELLNYFNEVGHRSGSPAQLIMTTHAPNLQDSVRRDQVWVAEKTGQGASVFSSFLDYRARTDWPSRHYLAGRFGGVPYLEPLSSGSLISEPREEGGFAPLDRNWSP